MMAIFTQVVTRIYRVLCTTQRSLNAVACKVAIMQDRGFLAYAKAPTGTVQGAKSPLAAALRSCISSPHKLYSYQLPV